jgi:sensor histidine kinase YesM
MNKNKFFLIVLAFCMFMIYNGYYLMAQKNAQFIYETKTSKLPFTVTQYSTKHGLPQNQVQTISKNPENNNLVLLTANGIVQFNGDKFKELIADKKEKTMIFSDLFFSTSSNKKYGVKYWGEFYQLAPTVKLIGKCVTVTQSNDLFYGIQKDGTLFQFDEKTASFHPVYKSEIINPFKLQISFPYIYITGDNGIIQYNLQTKKSNFLYHEFIHRVKKIDSLIYFLSHRDLFSYSEKTHEFKKIFSTQVPEISFLDLEKINRNEFFIASTEGLFHIKGGESNVYLKKDGLPSEFFHSLYYSKEDNTLFVGSGQKGLLQLNFKSASNIFKPNFFILNSLNSIVRFENKILVSTSNGNIFELKKDHEAIQYAHFFSNFSSASVVNDTLAIGTWGAGIQLVKNHQEVARITKGLINYNVHAVFLDSKKRIWVGTDSSISIGNNFNNLSHFKRIKGRVVCFYELKNKSICVGTSEGFYIIESNLKNVRFIGRNNGFYGKEVRSFYEDYEGKIWVGTYNGGIFCFHKNNLVSINSLPNCELPLDAFTLAKDNNNQFYFTGNLGLYSVNFNDLNQFYYRKKQHLIPFYFGEEAGIYNTEFNGGFQNNFLYHNSTFYFPSIEGVTIFAPYKPQKSKSNIQLNEIYVNDQEIDLHQNQFSPNTQTIEIFFSKANFNLANQVYFKYKLERNGVTQSFSELTQVNKLTFNLLRHGKYVLTICSFDSFNDSVPTEIKYVFEITSKFYQTTYFYLFLGLFLLIAGGIVMKIINERKSRKKNAIHEMNQHISELKILAIQARMNPHFIFNSLNSIKYFLIIDDRKRAEKTLDNFSKLLRKFLEYSDHQFIRIREELELIKLYVSIEQERFNHSFAFEIEIDENIIEEEIPTMLIQPFIENAIKHGVSNINYPGKIQLKIQKQTNKLVISIADNGIGFDEKSTNSKHESKGIKLVQGKITVMRQKYNVEVDLKIESKLNEGTKIMINIIS